MPVPNKVDSVDSYVSTRAPFLSQKLKAEGTYLDFVRAVGTLFSIGAEVYVDDGGTRKLLSRNLMR